VVEVKMRNHDRVDTRPAVLLAQPWQHAGPAVEEKPSGPFDEVTRLRTAGIGPGRRAADDREFHHSSVA
jgi:hypothetical protein